MTGPVEDAYSYIVTKLAGSSIFCDPVLWENHASFTCLGGDKCGLALTGGEDGTGFISLVFDNASEFTIHSFTEYVRKQLISIDFISKLDEKKLLSTNEAVRKTNVRTYDRDTSHVFICYNSLDRESVSHIARELETRNLNVWYDKRMTAGDAVVDTLNEKIRSSSVVLVLLGTHGFGKWQAHEVNQIIQVAIENGVRVVPGLLPNFKESDLPLVLKSYNYVSFSDLSYNAFDKIAEATRIGVRSEYEIEQEV
ncbi:toll/interleukin-1 receptor domain-containing protein [Ketobacter alkanivorans]|uniref:TIR domain-containing protein n=1 Tax=Ketobacter alkanivorans TaxID=1917421 RepID=A0A2K9LKZ0_9GAMM|nr:toll/interleukin-1 receptor domain-containing protein [Ketobacter alkanivorans]AUM12930.1 hypothetical protein Kalk_11070 [Ketobacter alkanivorans]